MAFKLTYATMFNPPEELHKGFDDAVVRLEQNLGKEYGMIINGKDVFADEKWEDRSPVNTDWVLAVMQKGNATQANMAIEAARKAFPAWSHTPWQKRVQLVRKAAGELAQKAGIEKMALLEQGLARWADVAEKSFGFAKRDEPGAVLLDQIGGAGKAAVEMRRDDRHTPEGEIAKAGIVVVMGMSPNHTIHFADILLEHLPSQVWTGVN